MRAAEVKARGFAPGPHQSRRLWDASLSGVFNPTHLMSSAWNRSPPQKMRSRAAGSGGSRAKPWPFSCAPGLCVVAALAACTVGPDYTPPGDSGVPGWKDSEATTPFVAAQSDPDPKWWNAFRDPVLTALIDRAIGGNLDVQQAVLRVVEARQGIVTARARRPAHPVCHRQLHA